MDGPIVGLTAKDIQKLAQAAGVDKPVTSVRVVGDRVELHLLGGMVVPIPTSSRSQGEHEAHPTDSTTARSSSGASQSEATQKLQILESLTVRQLKALAAEAKLQNYRKANKAALITMLSAHFTLEELETEVPF